MGEKRRILIVEDEQELVKAMKIRLEANNYQVYTAYDGEEGLEKAKSEKPDLIVLDVMMPKKNGHSFILEAKKDRCLKDIPIIVVTALPKMIGLFRKEGVTDYILKPFSGLALLEKIKERLN